MTNANLDMDIVRTFVAGVRLGSFSRAAMKVGRSQSAVSLQLRRLETQVGTRLFQREGRGLRLTENGDIFFDYAVRLLDLNDEALDAVTRRDAEEEIRIGIPPDLAETWLPHMLARFSRSRPGTSVEARVDRAATLLDDIGNKTLDLAIVWNRDPLVENSGAVRVASLPIIWIAPNGHVHIPSEKLALLMMGEPCLFRSHALAALQDAQFDWRITFTSSSLAGLWAAAVAGLGLAVRTPAVLPPGLSRFTHPALPDLGTVSLDLHTTAEPSAPIQHLSRLLVETIHDLF